MILIIYLTYRKQVKIYLFSKFIGIGSNLKEEEKKGKYKDPISGVRYNTLEEYKKIKKG